MSTNVPGIENPTDDDAQSKKVTAALELAEEKDDDLTTLLVEIIQAQAAEIEDLKEKVGESDESEPPSQLELHEYRLDSMAEGLEKIRSHSSDAEGGGQDDATTTQNGDATENDESLPIEKLAETADGEHPFPGGKPGPSVERAVEIYTHYRQWSGRKVMAGWTITEDLKKLLSTATSERLAWKQVYRACRKLEEWTNGEIEFKKTTKHGWTLVTENQYLIERSSSACGG